MVTLRADHATRGSPSRAPRPARWLLIRQRNARPGKTGRGTGQIKRAALAGGLLVRPLLSGFSRHHRQYTAPGRKVKWCGRAGRVIGAGTGAWLVRVRRGWHGSPAGAAVGAWCPTRPPFGLPCHPACGGEAWLPPAKARRVRRPAAREWSAWREVVRGGQDCPPRGIAGAAARDSRGRRAG